MENGLNVCMMFWRFLEALHYYSAIFDSLDATFPAESTARMKVEQCLLAPEIRNVVACEGAELGLYGAGDGYRLTEDSGCLLLGWQDRAIIAASAWRCWAADSHGGTCTEIDGRPVAGDDEEEALQGGLLHRMCIRFRLLHVCLILPRSQNISIFSIVKSQSFLILTINSKKIKKLIM